MGSGPPLGIEIWLRNFFEPPPPPFENISGYAPDRIERKNQVTESIKTSGNCSEKNDVK